MTEYLFMRHGETDANKNGMLAGKKNEPLNEDGVRQVVETARTLAGRRFDAVYCGYAKRVRQTFEIVRDSLVFDESSLCFSDEIREMHMGDWEGMNFKQVAEKNPDEWAAYMKDWTRFSFPNGESLQDYFEHCRTFINAAQARHAGRKIAVFGHKGFLLACACVLEKKPMEKLFDREIETGSYFFLKCSE